MNLKSQVNLILSFYTPLVFVHCFEFIFFSEMFLDRTNVEQQWRWCTVMVFILLCLITVMFLARPVFLLCFPFTLPSLNIIHNSCLCCHTYPIIMSLSLLIWYHFAFFSYENSHVHHYHLMFIHLFLIYLFIMHMYLYHVCMGVKCTFSGWGNKLGILF